MDQEGQILQNMTSVTFFSLLKDHGINTTQRYLVFCFHSRISREFIERLDTGKEEIMTVILD